MKRLHFRGALLLALGIAVQPGCGGRAGSQEGGQGVGGIAVTDCDPGNTRECVGPGACRGGQQCDTSGKWGKCECAAAGGASNYGTTGENIGGEGTGGTNAFAGASAQTGTGGSTAVGGSSTSAGSVSIGGAGGSGNVGATAGSAGTSFRPSGGQGGAGGHPVGGAAGAGGFTTTLFTGGTASGGTFTGGSGTKPTGGTSTGGTATGRFDTGGTFSGGATNHPPQLTSLGFYPNPVTKNDTLWIYAGANDADYDKITFTYAWMRNGQAVGYNAQTLSPYYFSRGDSITVTVTPSDGKSYGTAVTSQPIVVANAMPAFVTGPDLSPTPFADVGTPLKCSAIATDPDGDKVEYLYNWYNSDVPTSYHEATLPGSATTAGGVWYCEVVASDGTAKSWATSSEATTVATAVSGIYRTDTTWLAEKSPYILTGRVQVAAGATLKIEPGVSVLGNGYSLELWGSLQASGTAEKPILLENLYTYDYSTSDKPSKFTLAFAEVVGGQLLGSSTATLVNVSDSVLRMLEGPVYLPEGTNTAQRLERNLFTSSCGIYANGPVVLNSNTFVYTAFGCVDVQVTDTLQASDNGFYFSADLAVIAGSKSVDLTNSYWGGTADADIPKLILDNNDDLNILGEVKYLPTLSAASASAPAIDKTYFP